MAGGGVTKPFVVQCDKCDRVLSDTTALVRSDKERNILVVKGASNVVVDETVRDDADGGESEYTPISCAHCSSRVGRMYNHTGHHNAHLHHLVCLDIDAVKSYQLGAHQMSVEGHENIPTVDGGGGGAGEEHQMRTTALEQQMLKTENVMIIFSERMGAMESALRAMQHRLDQVASPSEPAVWGARTGGGGGVVLPMLPREQQQYGGVGGAGDGGQYSGGSPLKAVASQGGMYRGQPPYAGGR